MPRQKNDGRGRLGGRAKGTPNANNPIKQILRDHSLDYFARSDDQPSLFELDLTALSPHDRVEAELALLNYHTPKMQAASVDVATSDVTKSIEDRLNKLMDSPD